MNLTNQARRLFCASAWFYMTFFVASAQIGNTGSLNTWTTKPVSREHNQANQLSYVRIVRAAKQNDSDRVVMSFVWFSCEFVDRFFCLSAGKDDPRNHTKQHERGHY